MAEITGSTLFSGGEGVGVAMRAAGIQHLQGLEWDDDIANVARMNGFHTKTGDVRSEDYTKWQRPTILHASPVCKNASNAKADGEESAEDLETAEAVCRAIREMRPRCVTAENVWGYRNFEAFKNILKTLREQGYQYDYWHLNAADYGVAQTRKRLILVAALDFRPHRPEPTHDKKYYGGFSDIKPWVGWYESIEDLIPTLPESKFADWQLARLPEHLTDVLIGGGNRSQSFLEFAKENRPDTPGKRFRQDPSHAISATASGDMRAFVVDGKLGSYSTRMSTRDGDERFIAVTTSHNQRDLKAFIMSSTEQRVDTTRRSEEPIGTIKAGGERMARAFIVNTREQHHGDGITAIDGDKPIYAIMATSTPERHKAFLMQVQGAGGDGIREADEPMQPSASAHAAAKYRAFLVGDQHSHKGENAMVRNACQPSFVADTRPSTKTRAWLDSGKVVKMTPRALARFQSFPDSYILPTKTKLACEVIGNAVPPLLYQRVIEAQIELFEQGNY